MFAQRKMMAARLKRPCVVLAPELKHLYTAITRARVRVIFYDSRSLTFSACPLSEGGLRVVVPRGAHACGETFRFFDHASQVPLRACERGGSDGV